MENNSDSVLEMYLYETNTLLEQLDNIMLSAEQADTLSEDDVNEIFRIMHTLKGSAAMMESLHDKLCKLPDDTDVYPRTW